MLAKQTDLLLPWPDGDVHPEPVADHHAEPDHRDRGLQLGIFAWVIFKVASLALLGYRIERLLHQRSRPSHLLDI